MKVCIIRVAAASYSRKPFPCLARTLFSAGLQARSVPCTAAQHVRRVALQASINTLGVALAPKAALMVIGNEVLTGSVTDANTPWLAKILYSRGVDLVRVEYIPDDPDDIKSTVLRLKKRVGEGYVLTSGGIGPTHDDVTYESIASAFGVPLQPHQPTIQKMRVHYEKSGQVLNEARMRMAMLPQGAEVLDTPGLWVPLVNLHSVYILPGIPRLFKAMIEANKERFTGVAHIVEDVYTKVPEGDLAAVLTRIAEQHPNVLIGSYPNVDPNDGRYKVKISLQSRDSEAVDMALRQLTDNFEPVEVNDG